MDVRCKYCHIDYEIDESALHGESTVIECINCGLRFEVSAPEPVAAPSVAESAGAKRRPWQVRAPDGAVREVPELTMLQKWIFTGLVTREWTITVDGQTWKPLGNIEELEAFFGFAEDAYDAWETAATATLDIVAPAGQREDSSVELDLSQLEEVVDDEPPKGPVKAPRAPTEQGMPPPIPPALPIDVDAGGWPLVADDDVFEELHPEFKDAPAPSRRRLPPLPPGSTLKPPEGAEDGWSLDAISDRLFSSEPPPAPIKSPLETASAKKGEIIKLELPGREIIDSGAAAAATDEDWVVGDRPKPLSKPTPPQSSRAAPALAVIVALAVGAGVYWFKFRASDEAPALATVVPKPVGDSALRADAAPARSADEVAATARLAILASDPHQLRTARTDLATLEERTAALLALRSRTAAALAQSIADRAIIAGGGGPDSEVEALIDEAGELAVQAAAAGDDPQVVLAKADAARLKGDRASDVRRVLKDARTNSPTDHALIDAMLYERDGDYRRARRSVEEVVADADASSDSRPRLRLALLQLRAKDVTGARQTVAVLLETQPAHIVAKELAAAIEAAANAPVAAIEPPTAAPRPDVPPKEDPKESFEQLVARAEELAENVKCTEALALYNRALAINRRSVTVLSGMGFCEIELGKMAAAHQRFRAALKISPGHIDSLLGEAETFSQEGRRAEAIDTYRRILAKNPSAYYQKIARRQIKALGGDPDEGSAPAPALDPDPDDL